MSTGRVVLLRELKEGEKLAPQAKIIYETLLAHGVNKEIDREAFTQSLEGKIESRQPIPRVFGYYLQQFVKDELVQVIKPEAAPKPEKKAKAEKPAKGESPADAESKPEKEVA